MNGMTVANSSSVYGFSRPHYVSYGPFVRRRRVVGQDAVVGRVRPDSMSKVFRRMGEMPERVRPRGKVAVNRLGQHPYQVPRPPIRRSHTRFQDTAR